MTKGTKAVKSRDAGESLSKAKAEFAKSAKSKPEERLPPQKGETIVEPAEPSTPKRPKKGKLKKMPRVTKVSDRRDQAYEISKLSGATVGAIDSGDVSKIPNVVNWRVVSDKAVMINGYSTTMRAGALVNRLTHDLANLRSMGVVLEMVR